MTKVITDEKLIDEVLERGVKQIFPDRESFKKVLMSGKRIKLYCGYDPTAKSLHLGNAISINKLRQFQKLGHEVIFLVGDFTGMIGDPTDKSAARKKLTREEALANSENYKKQASAYLNFSGDNPAKILHNSQWSDPLTFKDLIEISSNFTVQKMITRNMFQKRLEEGKPIYLHEFLYPVAQGYDSVAMDVDLEIGGNDQMFNMLAGRDLMKALKNKEKYVMTIKLMEDESGKKMGKTEGNVVNLNETPENMFGQIMAWSDGLIAPGFELCTNIPIEEVNNIRESLRNPKNNPRDFKMKLAFEITKINHGEKEAKKAQEYFVKTIQKKEMPEKVPSIEASIEASIEEVMVKAGLAKSNSDAKRKISQGGVEISGKKITDIKTKIIPAMNGQILKVGKNKFIKIKIL